MPKTTEPIQEKILLSSMDEVMHNSMMPYAEHVILERALPRVEDGLKPVQRRILFTMLELGLTQDKPHRKSARIVGDCLGKYHPHGDSSVYDAMVRMAQPFNMRVPFVDGHGNFGSVDGDTAAAMRYTEARMTEAAAQLLRDIDRDTVPFVFNFDDTTKEPELLPGRFPNLLINGASGIAVGLATNIPPHNPAEAIDAVIAMMENPRIPLDELMRILPAPDFPTGGFLLASDEIRRAYETGRGKLTMRARTHFEEQKNGKTLIVVTELPYQVNKAAALEKILAVSQEKKTLFQGIGDIRDESDRQGMRAVIEVKKDGDPEKILQYLYKYSDLQCTFGVNMVAIAGGKPQQMGLKEILQHYIRHQRDVVTRRTKNELETAEAAGAHAGRADDRREPPRPRDRAHPRVQIPARGQGRAHGGVPAHRAAGAGRSSTFRLQRLTNLELRAIEREYAEVVKLIGELRAILASDKKLVALIKKELLAIRRAAGRPAPHAGHRGRGGHRRGRGGSLHRGGRDGRRVRGAQGTPLPHAAVQFVADRRGPAAVRRGDALRPAHPPVYPIRARCFRSPRTRSRRRAPRRARPTSRPCCRLRRTSALWPPSRTRREGEYLFYTRSGNVQAHGRGRIPAARQAHGGHRAQGAGRRVWRGAPLWRHAAARHAAGHEHPLYDRVHPRDGARERRRQVHQAGRGGRGVLCRAAAGRGRAAGRHRPGLWQAQLPVRLRGAGAQRQGRQDV